METARRTADLVRRIEEKVQVAALLAPRKVRLKLKAATVQEALAELTRQSGYALQLEGDRTAVADRRVTLDTGETTFWEALEQMCGQARLVERPAQAAGHAANLYSKEPPVLGRARPLIRRVAPRGGAQAPVPLPPPVQMQIQEFGILRMQPPAGPAGQIVLTPGDPTKRHVSQAGSVRVVLRPGSPGPDGKLPDHRLLLEVSAEPRLAGFQLVGTPGVLKAIDDQGQTLRPSQDVDRPENAADFDPQLYLPYGQSLPVRRSATVSLRKGEKPAQALKELSGTLTAQVTLPNEVLASIENVLKEDGRSADGKNGGTLRVNSVEKLANGDYRLQLKMENLDNADPFNNFRWNAGRANLVFQANVINVQGNVVIGGRAIAGDGLVAARQGLPELLDVKGNKYQIVALPSLETRINNDQMVRIATVHYRPAAGSGEPSRLVLHGNRTVTFPVPFRFENVPLE
jgi:hypothetical protein